MGRESRWVWRERVKRWKASGESAREFSAREGVNDRTLRHWSWLLGHERASGAAEFVEVSPASVETFDVELRGGRRVRVPASFDAETLQRLIAVLER